MEGARPHVVRLVAELRLKAALDLPRRLVGEGDGEDLIGLCGIESERAERRVELLLWRVFLCRERFKRFGERAEDVLRRQEGGMVGVAEAHEKRDALDEHGGLAAAGAGKHQKRPFGMEDGLALFVV